LTITVLPLTLPNRFLVEMEKNTLNIEITYANRSVRLSEKGHYLYISAAISYISLMKNLLLLQRTW